MTDQPALPAAGFAVKGDFFSASLPLPSYSRYRTKELRQVTYYADSGALHQRLSYKPARDAGPTPSGADLNGTVDGYDACDAISTTADQVEITTIVLVKGTLYTLTTTAPAEQGRVAAALHGQARGSLRFTPLPDWTENVLKGVAAVIALALLVSFVVVMAQQQSARESCQTENRARYGTEDPYKSGVRTGASWCL